LLFNHFLFGFVFKPYTVVRLADCNLFVLKIYGLKLHWTFSCEFTMYQIVLSLVVLFRCPLEALTLHKVYLIKWMYKCPCICGFYSPVSIEAGLVYTGLSVVSLWRKLKANKYTVQSFLEPTCSLLNNECKVFCSMKQRLAPDRVWTHKTCNIYIIVWHIYHLAYNLYSLT
jgi:hypothetical protein